MSKPVFRLFDFQVDNSTFDNFDDDDGDKNKDKKKFLIKMFGMNEKGKTFCIFVKDFLPFFYILVPDHWEQKNATQLKRYILNNLSDFYQNSIISCKLIKKKKLYGFDLNLADETLEFIQIKPSAKLVGELAYEKYNEWLVEDLSKAKLNYITNLKA